MTNVTAEEEFWKWFIQHEVELFDFDPDREAERERIFDQLATELQRVDPNLSFEFGPKSAKREFVISASGIEKAFPAVVSLTKAAPTLDRWQVTAFRPRRTPTNIVELSGKRVDQGMSSSRCSITNRSPAYGCLFPAIGMVILI
jgi:hypothetical protein